MLFQRRFDALPRGGPDTLRIVEVLGQGRAGNAADAGKLFHIADANLCHDASFATRAGSVTFFPRVKNIVNEFPGRRSTDGRVIP